MTLADLANYRPVKREPLCRPYRVYLVCASAAAVERGRAAPAAGLLEQTDIAARGPGRSAGLVPVRRGEPADVRRPRPICRRSGVRDRAGRGAARSRLRRVTRPADRTTGGSAARRPASLQAPWSPGADATLEPTGTSHFIVGDADGNVVSMTTTVESIFGSGRMVDGFFLNNQMTDFAFAPGRRAGAAGRQRGRSGQAPALVDGADDPADPRRPLRRSDRLGRRQCDPRLSSPSRWSPRSTGTCRCRGARRCPTSSPAAPTSTAR